MSEIKYKNIHKPNFINDPRVPIIIIIYIAIIVNQEISSGTVHVYETRLPMKLKFKKITIDYSEHALL